MKTTKDTQKHTKKQKKEKYRLRNWSEYNKSLIRRGRINLWLPSDITDWWYGIGRDVYSDKAIEAVLMIKAVYRLPLRATVGFVQSIFEQSGIELSVPDYTTLSRRAKKLNVVLNKSHKDITDLILDSTGAKVYGEGEWKVRKHGWSYRRTWKKIHLGIDSNGEIRAVVMSHSDTHDVVPAKELLAQENVQITDFYGDGAYDSNDIYQELEKRGVSGYHIPPQHNARITRKSHHERNKNIREIRRSNRDTWKQESGYHRRSLVETTMFRYKTTFGQQLSFRTESSQKSEIMIKCNILNMFHHLCEIDSYAVTP
jgi:IS5 family transposase